MVRKDQMKPLTKQSSLFWVACPLRCLTTNHTQHTVYDAVKCRSVCNSQGCSNTEFQMEEGQAHKCFQMCKYAQICIDRWRKKRQKYVKIPHVPGQMQREIVPRVSTFLVDSEHCCRNHQLTMMSAYTDKLFCW